MPDQDRIRQLAQVALKLTVAIVQIRGMVLDVALNNNDSLYQHFHESVEQINKVLEDLNSIIRDMSENG